MLTDPNHAACITIRYRNERYLLCADEVTNFLSNCAELGLQSPEDITREFAKIAEHIKATGDPGNEQFKLWLALLKEVTLSMQGAIFPDAYAAPPART